MADPNAQVRESVRTPSGAAGVKTVRQLRSGLPMVGAPGFCRFAVPPAYPTREALRHSSGRGAGANDSPLVSVATHRSDSEVSRPEWPAVPLAPSTFTIVVTS